MNTKKIIETNINGTLNILNASKNINYTSLIITGSSSEYGLKEKAMREVTIYRGLIGAQ